MTVGVPIFRPPGRWLPGGKTCSSHAFLFGEGSVFVGRCADYRVTEQLHWGAYGETYKAVVTTVRRSSKTKIRRDESVVIKTPTWNDERHFESIRDRWQDVVDSFSREYQGQPRLDGLGCAASVIDNGSCDLNSSKTPRTSLGHFLVQRFVEGSPLRKYVENNPEFSPAGRFRGMPNAEPFLIWCRMLACALLQVHQRQIIHGDIWPNNIMVESSRLGEPHPVFIDFGQAEMRELVVGTPAITVQSNPYLAPEGGGSVSADVYALGGVFLYLASGRDPSVELRSLKDIDDLKEAICSRIQPSLLRENCGIADVITRCLRTDGARRIPHAEGVLQDIETFMQGAHDDRRSAHLRETPCLVCRSRPERRAGMQVVQVPAILEGLKKDPIFLRMAELRTRTLLRTLQDMDMGVYDLIGEHEEIVSALTQCLSALQSGDKYLTSTSPAFWRGSNLGVNGRFLSMNRIVAERGASVQRVFFVTRDEMRSREVNRIMRAHLKVMRDVEKSTGRKASPVAGAPGYYAAFKVVKNAERLRHLRTGLQFGLLQGGGRSVFLVPIYRGDGVISSIQFRTAMQVESQETFFATEVADALPLGRYPFV